MRISTNMIFNQGVNSINEQTAKLLHTQQQVDANTRILRPSDDPVAASRALQVSQAKDVNTQFATNQKYATSSLNLEEGFLSDSNELLTRIRELAVQSGSSTLTASDRKSIATELRARYDELMGLANSVDGNGQYVFSGYMGTTKPFAASIDALILNPSQEVTYMGDSGQRHMQVSGSRSLEVSDAGDSVFMSGKSGNGYFTTTYASANTGTAVMDSGNVTNPSNWNSTNGHSLQVKFWVDSAGVAGTAGKTYYDIVDTTSNVSMLTGAAPASPPAVFGPPTGLRTYSSGQDIQFSQTTAPAFDFGSSVVVTGTPANGDAFNIAPSTAKSVFRTVADLVKTLENSSSGAKSTTDVNNAIANLDQASDAILTARAGIGSRLQELDFLSTQNSDLNLQYQQTLSDLQDLDYTQAISDLTRQKTNLDAAQLSFAKINQLTLFDYIK